MKLEDTVAFVTGANRGLGRALVEVLVAKGTKKIYAASRDPRSIARDERVVPIALDVRDLRQVAAAAERAKDVTLLINNAGTLASFALLDAPREQIMTD